VRTCVCVCVCVSYGRWFVWRCARRSRKRAGGSRFAVLHRGPQDLCPTSAASPRATRQPTLVFGSTTASLRSMMLTFARCRTCIHPPITSFHPSINPRVSLPLHENASSRPPLRHTQPVMTTTDLSQCGALSLVLATVTCSLFERPPSHRANLAHDTHTHTHTLTLFSQVPRGPVRSEGPPSQDTRACPRRTRAGVCVTRRVTPPSSSRPEETPCGPGDRSRKWKAPCRVRRPCYLPSVQCAFLLYGQCCMVGGDPCCMSTHPLFVERVKLMCMQCKPMGVCLGSYRSVKHTHTHTHTHERTRWQVPPPRARSGLCQRF
jgi:hypothetical protein